MHLIYSRINITIFFNIFQTCFDGTSVIFSVTYFEIAIEFKARAILQSSKYVTLKMTDVPSKHVWKIKESCYVYKTIYVVAAI